MLGVGFGLAISLGTDMAVSDLITKDILLIGHHIPFLLETFQKECVCVTHATTLHAAIQNTFG